MLLKYSLNKWDITHESEKKIKTKLFLYLVWYIYYPFCNKDKISCDGYGVLIIKEGEYLWKNQGGNKNTEEYWVNNFKRLFKCDSCNYAGQSFKDFIGNDNLIVNVNNDSTTMVNTTQINSQSEESIKVQLSIKLIFYKVIFMLYFLML